MTQAGAGQDQGDDGNIERVKHLEALDDIHEGQLLWRCDNDGAVYVELLPPTQSLTITQALQYCTKQVW